MHALTSWTLLGASKAHIFYLILIGSQSSALKALPSHFAAQDLQFSHIVQQRVAASAAAASGTGVRLGVPLQPAGSQQTPTRAACACVYVCSCSRMQPEGCALCICMYRCSRWRRCLACTLSLTHTHSHTRHSVTQSHSHTHTHLRTAEGGGELGELRALEAVGVRRRRRWLNDRILREMAGPLTVRTCVCVCVCLGVGALMCLAERPHPA